MQCQTWGVWCLKVLNKKMFYRCSLALDNGAPLNRRKRGKSSRLLLILTFLKHNFKFCPLLTGMPAANPIKMFLLLAVALFRSSLAAAPTANTPNNIYADAGVYTLNTATYFGTGTTTLNPLSFTITYASGRTEPSTNYIFGYSIVNINYQIVSQSLNISFLFNGPATTTTNTGQLYTSNANKINLLAVGYVLLEPLFGVYKFYYQWMSPKRNFINGNFYEVNMTGLGPFNLTGGLTVFNCIAGVDATLTNNEIDLYIATTAPSTTILNFKFSTASVASFYLNTIVIGAFAYNAGQLSSYNRSATFTVSSSGSVSPTTLTYTNNLIRSYNTLIGLQSYHITNKGYFQYTSTINNGTSLSVSTNVSIDYYLLDYIVMRFAYCASPNLYFYVALNSCYATCPARTSSSSFYSECYACPTYDCYYCASSGLCTQCSATDNRYLSNTSRCLPNSGYYDDGSNSLAPACNANCLTCTTSATYCTTCNAGKYLTGTNTCAACITNCAACTAATSCTTCNTGYTYTAANNSCWLNCSTISHCSTCTYTTSLTCSTCANGYYLSSNTCPACITNCVTCSSGSSCTTCITGYTYTAANNSCWLDCSPISHCFTCSYTTSLACSACASTYYLSSPTACTACISHCLSCSSPSNCITCSTGYAYNSSSLSCLVDCSPIYSCTSCTYSSSLTCTACATNYNLTGNLCVSTLPCTFTYCSSCTQNTCIHCHNGYSLQNNGNCAAVCGDGALVSGEQCDDGNTNNNDGCSSQCTVQTDYTCNGQPSVCSINNLQITTLSIMKDTTANAFTVTYQFQPGLNPSYASINWNTQITQNTNINASITNLHYDISSGQLSATFAYTHYLNALPLSLSFSPPTSAPFNLLTTQTLNSTLTTSNNLNLDLYSDSEYTYARIIQIACLCLTAGCLLMFLLGFYYGKLIAIETLMVYQLTLFSLLAIQDLTPSFNALTQLTYCKGYNLNISPTQYSISRQYYPLSLLLEFYNNYNITSALVFIHLLIAGTILLLSFLFCKNNNSSQLQKAALFLGQITLYGLYFSLYSIVVALGISVTNVQSQNQANSLGIVIGCLFILLLIVYLILLIFKPTIMGQFTDHFKTQSPLQSHFYTIVLLQRIFQSIAFVAVSVTFQLVIVICLIVAHIVILVCKQPYKQKLTRSLLNNIISLIIVSAILAYSQFVTLIRSYGIFVPFAIVALLLFTLLYNFYKMVAQIRNKAKQSTVVSPYKLRDYSFAESKRHFQDNEVVLVQEQRPPDKQSNGSRPLSNESLLDASAPSTVYNKKQKKYSIEQMEERQVRAHIDNLNADFVANNPLMHAFRLGEPIKKIKQNPVPRQFRTDKKHGESKMMSDLLSIQESLQQMKENRKQRAKRLRKKKQLEQQQYE